MSSRSRSVPYPHAAFLLASIVYLCLAPFSTLYTGASEWDTTNYIGILREMAEYWSVPFLIPAMVLALASPALLVLELARVRRPRARRTRVAFGVQGIILAIGTLANVFGIGVTNWSILCSGCSPRPNLLGHLVPALGAAATVASFLVATRLSPRTDRLFASQRHPVARAEDAGATR